jgi:hypothetical protein
VARLDDERTPEGMVCLGTRVEGRLIARCVVPKEMAEMLEERRILRDPVPLALAVKEAAPGLQCRLFAVVDLPADALAEEEEPEAPWASSVPSSHFDTLSHSDDEPGESQRVAVLLGHVVRFEKDRRHRGNLPLEAADVLAALVAGRASDVVDKVLEDLIGPG